MKTKKINSLFFIISHIIIQKFYNSLHVVHIQVLQEQNLVYKERKKEKYVTAHRSV